MKRIPPINLIRAPETEEGKNLEGFKWAGADVGTRNRLGGEPPQTMSPEHWPSCPDCRERMTFYGQLDSISDQYAVADVGLICVFFCFDCNETTAVIASS